MTRPIVMFMMQYIIYLTISVFMVLAWCWQIFIYDQIIASINSME
jgi:hypothetical protein